MSSSFHRYVSRHAVSQERKLGEPTFIYEEEEYPGVIGLEDEGVVIDEQGNAVKYTGKVRVRWGVFEEDALPAKGDVLTVHGQVRKIAHVQRLQDALVWFYLEDDSN